MAGSRWDVVVTNEGVDILTNFADHKLTITGAAASDGLVPEAELKEQTDLTGNETTMNITRHEVNGNVRKIYLQKNNAGMTTEFLVHQIAIYITVDDGERKTFAMCQRQRAEYIPTWDDAPDFLWEPYLALGFGNAENVIINVSSESGATVIYVDKKVEEVNQKITELDGSKQGIIKVNGVLKGNGAGGISAAVAGTDYATPANITSALNGKIIIQQTAPAVVNGAIWIKY